MWVYLCWILKLESVLLSYAGDVGVQLLSCYESEGFKGAVSSDFFYLGFYFRKKKLECGHNKKEKKKLECDHNGMEGNGL